MIQTITMTLMMTTRLPMTTWRPTTTKSEFKISECLYKLTPSCKFLTPLFPEKMMSIVMMMT